MKRSGIALAVLAFGAVLWWAWPPAAPPSGDARAVAVPAGEPAAAYVGRAACADCHPRESAAWTGSHHDLAMDVASEATVLGDFDDARVTRFGVTSTFSRRDGRYVVRTDGPDGALRDFEIAYTFGVTPLQQYLVRFDDGRVQALGLAWDSRPRAQGGQRWFHLYPDEAIPHTDPLHWTRPAQTWNARCADCHSTNVQRNFDPARNTYATTWAEIDVSCEACHGPASRHVDWARAAGRGRAARDADPQLAVRLRDPAADWIVAPGQTVARRSVPLASNAQVETCARCHALRVAFAGPEAAGRPLLDSQRPRLLEEELYHPDGQMLDEVYNYGPFVQSRMYAAGVRCSDCHDPHSLTLRAPGNALCGTCHVPDAYDTASHHFHPSGSPGASCVACHMPARTYMVVDPRHDHAFRVPRPDLAAALGTPDACTACHETRTPAWAADAIAQRHGAARRRGPHYGEALHAGRRGAPGAIPALAALARDPARPAIVRATALQLLGQRPGDAASRAIDGGLADPDALVRTAAVMALAVRPLEWRAPRLIALTRDPIRSVRIEAARLLAGVRLGGLETSTRSAVERAFDELVRAERHEVDTAGAHLNLGVHHARRGDAPAAESEYRLALRLDPLFVPAWLNLADLARERGDEAAGERLLRDALARVPDSPDLHHALGLALVRQRRHAEGLGLFARAAALSPDRGPHAYVHAVALHESGRAAEAWRLLERALESRPYDADLLTALARYAHARGDRATALRFAERLAAVLPDDPAVRAMVDALR